MMGPMGGAMGLFGFSPFGMQPFVGAPPKPADLVAQGKMSAEKAAKIEKEMQAGPRSAPDGWSTGWRSASMRNHVKYRFYLVSVP